MNRNMKVIAIVLVAGMVISLIGVAILSGNQSNPTAQSQNANLTSEQQNIFTTLVKRYKCLCGDCTLGLYNCTCDAPKGAEELKGFIKYNLAQGKTRNEVISLVANRYDMQPAY